MAGNYKVSVDLSAIFGMNQAISDSVFPLIGQAVRAVAEEGAFRWRDAVYKAKLLEPEKTAYVESISCEMVTKYKAEISTVYKNADEIENGRPARDMKRMLQTSQKVRMAKGGAHAGQRYLIIPFRHNTPTDSSEGAHAPQMPASVYALAKKLAPSKLLPPGSVMPASRLSASGAIVPQHSYSWGQRLPAGTVPKLKGHATDRYDGMVRFDTSTPAHGKTKAVKSSSFLTFRVMGEWSSGWVVKAKAGLNITQKVAADLQPILDDAIGQAVTLKSLRR